MDRWCQYIFYKNLIRYHSILRYAQILILIIDFVIVDWVMLGFLIVG